MFKKGFIGLLAAALITSGTLAYGSSTAESLNPPMPPGNAGGYMGLSALPNFLNSFTNPGLIAKTVDSSGKITAVAGCKSMKDPACSTANFFQATTLFDFCPTAADTNCIQSLQASKSDGTKLDVNLGDSFPGPRSLDYTGDPALKLPGGATTHLVHIPGAKHASGDLYLVVVNPQSTKQNYGGVNDSVFSTSMQAAIFAVSITQGNYETWPLSTKLSDYTGWDNPRVGVGGGAYQFAGCIMNDANLCAVPEAIPTDISFKLDIKVNYSLLPWFSGRITNSNVSITSLDGDNQLFSVEANPVRVPAIAHWTKKTDLPQPLVDYYNSLPKPLGGQMPVGGPGSFAEIEAKDPSTWSLLRNLTGYDEGYMQEFLLWLPVLGDKADAVQTMWSVRSMNGSGNECINGSAGVTGFVSTNATQYIEGPPSFDSASGTLNYKVAAPHYESDGTTVFKGTYDLAINSKAARCLYKFSNAPVKATIEVVSADGKDQVASTVVTEHDGWLYLRAAGFSFSNPLIKVKLSQDAPAPAPTPSASPTPTVEATPTPSASPVTTTPAPKPTVAVQKKSTIVCVKGKSTKSVTAVKPTCPTGYKKK